jgi:GTPase SAR1 family protein
MMRLSNLAKAQQRKLPRTGTTNSCSKVRHTEIEKYLKKERENYTKYQLEPKLLILGASDSGKSTLLKQLKILHGNGFSEEEKRLSKRGIIGNMISGLVTLLSFNENTHSYLDLMQLEQDWPSMQSMPETTRTRLIECWKEKYVQEIYQRGGHGLPDNMS